MRSQWRSSVIVAMAAGIVLVAQALCTAGLTERLKPELDRAWDFGTKQQYDRQLAIYDALLRDPEVVKSSFDGLIKAMAVTAAANVGSDEAIRRAESYLKGNLGDVDRATVSRCLVQAYIEKGRLADAKLVATKALALRETADEQKAEIRKLAARVGGPAGSPPPPDTADALMGKASSLEAEGKTAEAIQAYTDALKQPRLPDNKAAHAAERILAISEKNAEAAGAFARGVWEHLYDGEANTRVRMALARRLVRLGDVDEAQRVLSEIDLQDAGRTLEKQARELVGEELLCIGDERVAKKDYGPAAEAYTKAIREARSAAHRAAAHKGCVTALIGAGRLDDAMQMAEDGIDDAHLDPEKAGAILLKIQVLLAKDDLKGAQGCIDAIDQIKDTYAYHRITSRIMVGKHILARAKTLEGDGKIAEAYKVYIGLLDAADTPGEIVNRASERKLALMPKVLKNDEVVAECDRMLADRRMENIGNSLLSAKMSAQLRLGRRDDARRTAAVLLAHPKLYTSQGTAVEKEFGGELSKPATIDDAQLAERVKAVEKTIHSSASAAAKADACRTMVRLHNGSGRAKEAEKRARELLNEFPEPYVRQSVYRELYDAQIRLDDISGAVLTARAMIAQLASRDIPNRTRMRELVDEVFTDLARQLGTRKQLDRERDLMAELKATLGRDDLPPDEAGWCRQKAFTVLIDLGDMDAALAFYRENADAISATPSNLPPIVSALAKAAGTKPDLVDDAVAAARNMIPAASGDPKVSASVRAASASSLADLTKTLVAQGHREKVEVLLGDLRAALQGRRLDDAGKAWCLQTAFDICSRLGEYGEALNLLKGNASGSSMASNAVPGAIAAAAVSMGKGPNSLKADDIAEVSAWYLERNASGLDTSYAGTVFNAVIRAYTNEGRPAEAAKFIEKTVRGATERQRNAEDWKYHAAEIYWGANMPAEARRAALELEARWPASRDRAQLLLACIEAPDDPDCAAKRIAALPKSAPGPELLLAGKNVIAAYQKRQEWAKAASLYEQLSTRIDAPLDKQALYEGLYGMQMKASNLDGAMATARSLLAMSLSPLDAQAVPAVRAAATRVVTDLSKELTKRGMASRTDVLLNDLLEKARTPGLDGAAKEWALDHIFSLYCVTGSPTKACRFLRENLPAFRKAPGDLAGAVYSAAQTADKAELPEDKAVTIGMDAGSGALDDVFFAADWFFRNDKRQGPIYAEGIFKNLENTGKRSGNLAAMAQFFEKTVAIASPDAKFQEKWGYRAAEIYFDSRDHKEAHRALTEVQKKWPSQWEKTELLLARIDASESSPTVGERLRVLHAKATDSRVWFESGEELIRIHRGQGEWAKAVALQQELGARDPRRLFTWAYDYQKQRRYGEAIPLYEQYRKNSPRDYRGYAFPATCLIRLKRWTEAVALYDAASQSLDGTSRESASLAAASVFLDDLRQYAEAERRFRAFTLSHSDSREIDGAWSGIIRSLCGLGRHDEAVDLSRKKLAEAGDGTAALSFRMLLSESLSAQGKGAEALAVLEEAVARHKLDRENLPAWVMVDFAQAHKASGDAGRAAAIANDVLRKYPNDERACERAREMLK